MFRGRVWELSRLREQNWRDQAQLVVVTGRRRVGKTALVEKAYEECELWRFDGLEGGSTRQQLAHFSMQLRHVAGESFGYPKLGDWEKALDQLAVALERRAQDPLVVFFDEFQWMAGMRSPLVSLFKSYWDFRFSKNRRHRFVLCGSVSSFMVKRVIRSKALYGRVSVELDLHPLSLGEMIELFDGNRLPEEVLEIAMCFGGVPQYLKELNPGLSLIQNLSESAFRPAGFFFGELQRLFISHFGKNPIYEKVLRLLSARPRTASQLASACGTHTGGRFTDLLGDLELAGFIERYRPIGKGARSRQVRLRILDEYLHFYFRFIDSARREILTGRFEPALLFAGNDWRQWQGYAFERLCRRHARQIADALRFSGIRYEAGSWFAAPAYDFSGAQVDLLFLRADRMLTVCEAKFTETLHAAELVRQLDRKVAAVSKAFPRHGIQRVLLLGKPTDIPAGVAKQFDAILRVPDLVHTSVHPAAI